MKHFALLLLVALTAIGCGPGYSTQPVTGKVTLDGAPLAGATVTFNPTTTGKPATGVCDANGVYKLVDMRPEGAEGAEVGEYTIGVLWYKPSENDTSKATGQTTEYVAADQTAATRAKVAGPKSELPVAYQNPQTSGLTASIKSGANTVDFALESTFKGAAKK